MVSVFMVLQWERTIFRFTYLMKLLHDDRDLGILRNFSFPACITPERSIYTWLSLRLPVGIWNTQAVANAHFRQQKRPVRLWLLTHSENNFSICITLNISSLNASLKSQQVGNFLHSKTQYEPLFYNTLASTVCSSVHVCFCYDVEYLC